MKRTVQKHRYNPHSTVFVLFLFRSDLAWSADSCGNTNTTAPPTITNVLISQDKASSASSENSAGSASSKAFDGDMGSRWESAHGIEDVWLQVDLGITYVISKVVVDWEFAAAKIYDIEVSNDGVSFTSVWSKNDGFGGMGSVESDIGGSVTGRFVRMHAFERATGWGYSIFEMKVYGFSP